MKQSGLIFFLFNSIIFFPTIGFAADNATRASEGLRDVRDPASFPANYLFFLVIVLVFLISGCAAYIFLKRKQKDEIKELPVDTRHPWEIAHDQLDQLAKSSYVQEECFKEYYSELSGIIRRYFENRFNIRAPEMTTEEFLWFLERSKDLKTGHKEALQKFMTSCDIIKFAKHIPRVEEAEDSFRFARQLVNETKITDDT